MATKVNHGEIETYFKLVFLAFRWLATRINALLGRWGVDQQVDLLSRIHFFISQRHERDSFDGIPTRSADEKCQDV